MSDPGRLPGLDLFLVGLVAQLLRVDVTIASNKVMLYATVRSLNLVRPRTESPCSPPSSLLSCLLPSSSRRIASAPVVRAAALLWRWSWLASTAGARSRRRPAINPEDKRPLPLDVHLPTVLDERRSWLRLLLVADAFVPNDSLLECDLLLVHRRSLLPATTSSEEVLTILVAFLQLPQSHVAATNLPVRLLVEVLIWIGGVQPCRAQVAKVCLTPVADPKRQSEGVAGEGVIEIHTYDCNHAFFEQDMHKLDTAWCAS